MLSSVDLIGTVKYEPFFMLLGLLFVLLFAIGNLIKITNEEYKKQREAIHDPNK